MTDAYRIPDPPYPITNWMSSKVKENNVFLEEEVKRLRNKGWNVRIKKGDGNNVALWRES